MAKLIIHDPLGDSRVHELVDEVTTIGRGLDNVLRVDDGELSRDHCRIEKVLDDYQVVDLSSVNGTFVNGVRVERHVLQPGDELKLGSYRIVFYASAEEGGTVPEQRDERLGKLVLDAGRATPAQVEEAKKLAVKMRGLGLEKDLLDALVERGVVSEAEAGSLRSREGEADSARREVAPDPLRSGPATAPRPAGRAAPSSRLPPCANHPYMPGIYKCGVCGKTVCMQCVVRTSKGLYCSQECTVAVDPARGAAAGGASVQLPVKAIVVVAVVLLVVAWGVLSSSRPSEDVARARELRAAVEELEKEDKLAEALASARELASLRKATDQEEVTTLADWGESRVGILHMGVARAELDAFKEGLSDIEALDAATLAARKEELARLAAKHADLPSMTKSVDRLMEKIDARLARVKAERGEVEEDARLATLSAALAEARREADALMRELRFGRALAVVDRHRNEMPAELTAAFGGRFDELKEWILAGARAAYEQKEVAADNYVLNGRNEDAKKVYREVIETFGVEDLTGKAQKALKSLGAEKPRVTAAAKQDELKLVERVVALTEKMLKTMDYIGAKLEIEEATLGVKGRQAVHRLDALAERVQRDEEAFMRILDMIGKKPVRLSAIRKDGKGQISAADSAGYTVTVGDQRAGTSSVDVKAPWSRMAAGELCKLAEMAAADDVDSLVDLALFCAGRGAREEYLAARSRVMNSAEAGKNPLERFEGVLEEPKGERPGPAVDRKGVRAGEKEDEEDEKEKKEAPEDDANQEGADTGKETAPETEADTPDTPGAPAAIDGTCPYCKGSGTVESIGCGKCRATSVDGSRHCENCAATGRASHDCRNCRGQGFLIVDGRQHECPLCRGKGHPPCDFCRGTGLVKIANPDASPVPTKPCPFCKGERYNVKFKCKSCSGSGKKLHSSTEGRIRWTMSVTCPICKGEGEGPPVCANCSAKGYVGSSNTPKLCRTCMGTGHVYPPCRACAGRGWLRAGK